MNGNSRPDFLNIELDRDLLSMPFRIQTKWCVITGAPCSGKTTLIKMLANAGFQTVPEAGRKFFENELSKGHTITEIREDQAAFTRQVYDIMLDHENRLQPTELNFLDRALPDGCAFYRLAGLNPNAILEDCFQHRYASVFVLKRLPYQKDEVRLADNKTAAYLESWTLRDYSALGYKVNMVPVLTPKRRFEFILDRLTDQGQI